MKAFTAAKDLAKKYHAELVVLTAVEASSPYFLPQVPPGDEPDTRRYETDKDRKELTELVRLAKADRIDARAEVLDKGGPAIKQILDYAERGGFDLIVAGTRGLGGFSKILLGSVSTSLVSHAHCPVLVAR